MKPHLFDSFITNKYIENYKNKIDSNNFIKNNIYNIISFLFILGIILYLIFKYKDKKNKKELEEEEYIKKLELENIYNYINLQEKEKNNNNEKEKEKTSNIDYSIINKSMDPIDYVPDPLEYNIQNDLNIIDLTNKQYTTMSNLEIY